MTDNNGQFNKLLLIQALRQNGPGGIGNHLKSADFGKECATWAADFAFGIRWSREGMERGRQRCAVLGMLIALRQTRKSNTTSAGLTMQELGDIVYLSAPCAGFPAANTAKQAMIEVLREIASEAQSTAKESEHRWTGPWVRRKTECLNPITPGETLPQDSLISVTGGPRRF